MHGPPAQAFAWDLSLLAPFCTSFRLGFGTIAGSLTSPQAVEVAEAPPRRPTLPVPRTGCS